MKKKAKYEVGYGKPPKAHQFPSKTSGNPCGRPKKPKARLEQAVDEEDPVLAEANRVIKIREGDKQKSIKVRAAVLRTQTNAALKGSVTAQRDVTKAFAAAERQRRKHKERLHDLLAKYKAYWTDELPRLKVLGWPTPNLEIHPDDIYFDTDGNHHIIEPTTREQAAFYDRLEMMLRDHEQVVASYRQDLIDYPDYQDFVKSEMYRSKRVIRRIKQITQGPEVELVDYKPRGFQTIFRRRPRWD